MSMFQMLLASTGGNVVVNPFYFGAKTSLAGVGGGQATASVDFNTNGAMTYGNNDFYDPNQDGTNDGVTGPNWFDPPSTGIGALYWLVMLTPSVGTFTSGTLNTRLQLSTIRTYTATTSGGGIIRSKYVKAAFEIWDASSGGNKVCDGQITLSAEVDNS